MIVALRLAVSGLMRAPGRSLIRVLVLTAAVALLGGMLLFVGNSLRTVAGSSVRSVPLDLQAPASSYAEAQSVAAGVARQIGVLQASPAATAPLAGAEHSGPGGLTSSGAGAVLAVPSDYASHIHTFRFLQGALRAGAVVLDQQMAATLQAHIGDRITLKPSGHGRPQTYPVSGVALVTAPDQLFQPLNPQLGPAPAQPPANVAILPLDTFASTLAPQLPTISAANPGTNTQPGAQTGVQWQVQAQLDPVALSGGSPSTALTLATQTRNRIERSLPGRVQFVDNLSDSLNTAAGDALYAQTLYIMLAVPGALIALGLAYLAALGTVERDRHDLALLRARGARAERTYWLWPAQRASCWASSPGSLAPPPRLAQSRCSSPAAHMRRSDVCSRPGLSACCWPPPAPAPRASARASHRCGRAWPLAGAAFVGRESHSGSAFTSTFSALRSAGSSTGSLPALDSRLWSTRTPTRRCRCPCTCSSRRRCCGSG